MNFKRIAALLAVILLVLSNLLALVFALIDHPLAPKLLIAALFCTIVLPGVIYGYQIILKYLKNNTGT